MEIDSPAQGVVWNEHISNECLYALLLNLAKRLVFTKKNMELEANIYNQWRFFVHFLGDGENVTPSSWLFCWANLLTPWEVLTVFDRLGFPRCVENHCHEVRDFSYSFAEAYRKAEQTPGVATQGKPNGGGGFR